MLLIFIFFMNFAQANDGDTSVECNYEAMEKFCAKMQKTEQTQLRSKSPHKFSNGMQMPSIDSLKGSSIGPDTNGSPIEWRDMKKLQKLFAETKKYSIEAILQGRSEEQISEEEKNMLSRVKLMTLSDLSHSEDQKMCKEDFYYGYTSRTNSLVMCPGIARYPDSAIVMAMSSFVGRSLGNCVTGFMSIKNPAKKIDIPVISKDKHTFNQFCHMGGCEKAKADQGLMNCLRDGGISDGDDPIDYSTKEAQQLVDNHIKVEHQKKNSKLPVAGANRAESLKKSENVEWAKNQISENKYCFPEVTNARMDSGIQDWFGAEVTARYLEDNPLKAKTAEDNLQPLATMIDYICRTKNDEITRLYQASTESRFNAAIFTNERLRKVMNCSPAKSIKKNCSVSTFHPAKGTAPLTTPAGATRAIGQ